ncbi:YggS family pyridoxal phosphate enzyme [Bacteroidia bacterium]|nr:YggS family pyridoxal phosphate enzyme [Bacteroidia bacterium]
MQHRSTTIHENIARITAIIPHVKLIVVSKQRPIEDIQAAYSCGQRRFGENKALELADKYKVLPKDIEWHFIGHLQTNKVKHIAPFISLIHSVDSLKLMEAIDREGLKNNRVIDCLLQFYIAKEETKFGLDETEAIEILESESYKNHLRHTRIIGVMGMATFTDDVKEIKREFATLKKIFERIRQKYFSTAPFFRELSMGMSADYQHAITEGSTMVRIGTDIFKRDYIV